MRLECRVEIRGRFFDESITKRCGIVRLGKEICLSSDTI